MSCGCNNGKPDDKFDHMRYMRQSPTHNHHCGCHHHHLFMPFQPPPWLGHCCPPPPRQAGPWEYTPSHMYPGPPPCGCGPLPHIPPPYGGCYPHHHHHHHHSPYGPMYHYDCLPQQAPECGCHHRPIYPNPIGPHPDIPPRPIPAPPPDKPEFAMGSHRIVHSVDTPDHSETIVEYSDGRFDIIAHGYVPFGDPKGNGPKCGHSHDIRGNISDSEGLDTVNFQFNTSDAGSNF